MKYTSLGLVLALVGAAQADQCPGAQLGKYIKIVKNAAMKSCQDDSGFMFMPPSGQPDDQTLGKMCQSANCKKLVELIGGVDPMDCDLNINGKSVNAKKLVNQLASCGVTPPTPTPTPDGDTADRWGKCGDAQGFKNCPSGQYCLPWDRYYYQCVDTPSKCSKQFPDTDFYGEDLFTVYNLKPEECCDKCAATEGCVAYTFVNEGTPSCYLKKGMGAKSAKKGAVSGVVDNVTPPPTPERGGKCGDAQGYKNCQSGQYCMPWDRWYYQCLDTPSQCGQQFTDTDFYGEDLFAVFNIKPEECCDRCASTSGCVAYTFINEGTPSCYLKKGMGARSEKKGAVSSVVTSPSCSTPAGGNCGNDNGITCCPSDHYCQPWNSGYYQCIQKPSKCGKQMTNVDFYGNDIKVIYGVQPEACCNACAETDGCKAYTFVNSNPGSPACYLKSGEGEHRDSIGVVSGVLN